MILVLFSSGVAMIGSFDGASNTEKFYLWSFLVCLSDFVRLLFVLVSVWILAPGNDL